MTTVQFRGEGQGGTSYLVASETWLAFGAWASKLPPLAFPAVVAFANAATVADADSLRRQLRRGLRGYSCPHHVADVVRTVLRLLGDDVVVAVTT